jgi:hypothetical protein
MSTETRYLIGRRRLAEVPLQRADRPGVQFVLKKGHLVVGPYKHVLFLLKMALFQYDRRAFDAAN